MQDSLNYLEAKIISIDENYFSISGYYSLHGVACPLDQAQSRWTDAVMLSRKRSKPIGKAYDAKYWEINTYHQDVLKEILLNE